MPVKDLYVPYEETNKLYQARQTCLAALNHLPLRVNILVELPRSKTSNKPHLDIQDNCIQVRVDESNVSVLLGPNNAAVLLAANQKGKPVVC